MAITAVLPTRTAYFTDVVTMIDATGSTTDDPNGITQYEYDFGDGTIVTTTEAYGYHRYLTPQTGITISLTVTNSLLETNTVTSVIDVVSPEVDTSEQLRRYIIAFMDVFNNLQVTNKDGSAITVPCIYGASDRVQAYIRGETTSGNQGTSIPLPIISSTLVGISPDPSRRKGSNQERFMSDPNNTDIQQYAINPSPVNLEFDLGIWSYDYGQAFSILETIIPWFDQGLKINVGDYAYSGLSELVLENVNDENVLDLGTDRRIVRYTLQFTIYGYLPRNRFVSDYINASYYNLSLTL